MTKTSADIPTTSYPELSGDEADIEAYSHDGDTSDHSRSPVDSSPALPPRIVPTVEIEDATVLRTDQSKKGDSAFLQPLNISKASVLEPGAISYTSDWTFVSSSSWSWRPPKWDEIMYAKNLHSVATAPRSFLGGADIWTQKVRKDDEDTKLKKYRRLKELASPSKLLSPVPFKSTKALTPAPDHREVPAGASGSSGTQYRYDPFQHDSSPTTPSDAKTPPDYPVSPITPSPDSSVHNQNQSTYLTWQLLSPSQNLQPREAIPSEYHPVDEPTVLKFSPAARFKKQLLIIGYEQTWLTNPTLQDFINYMQHLHDQGTIELAGAIDEDTAMQHLTPAPHPNSSRSPLLPSAIFVTDPGVFRHGFDLPVALRNYVAAGGHLVFGGPFAALVAEHELDVFSRAFSQTWTLDPIAYGLIWAHAAHFRANFGVAPEACGLDGPRWATYRGVRDVQPGEVYETAAADFPSRDEAPYDPRSPPVLYERLGAVYDSMVVDSPPVVYERMGHGSLAYIGIIEDDMLDPEFTLERLLLHILEYEPDRDGEGDAEDQAYLETQEAAEGEYAAEEQEDVEEASTIAADDGDNAVEERSGSVDTVRSASSMEMVEGKRRRKSRVTTEVDERDSKGVKINETDESVTEGEKLDEAEESKTEGEKFDEADESKTKGEKTEDSDEEETQGPKIDKGKGKVVYDDWIVEHFMME